MQEHQVLGELCLLMQLFFLGLMQGSDILFLHILYKVLRFSRCHGQVYLLKLTWWSNFNFFMIKKGQWSMGGSV